MRQGVPSDRGTRVCGASDESSSGAKCACSSGQRLRLISVRHLGGTEMLWVYLSHYKYSSLPHASTKIYQRRSSNQTTREPIRRRDARRRRTRTLVCMMWFYKERS